MNVFHVIYLELSNECWNIYNIVAVTLSLHRKYNDNRVVADHPVSEDCHVACNVSSLLLVNPDNDKMTPS